MYTDGAVAEVVFATRTTCRRVLKDHQNVQVLNCDEGAVIISAYSEIEFAVCVDVTSVSFCFTWRTTGASIANQTELAPATDDNAMIELAGG